MNFSVPVLGLEIFSFLDDRLIQNDYYDLWNLFVQHLGKKTASVSHGGSYHRLKEAMLCEISGSFIIELNNLIAHDIHGGLNNLTQLAIYH